MMLEGTTSRAVDIRWWGDIGLTIQRHWVAFFAYMGLA